MTPSILGELVIVRKELPPHDSNFSCIEVCTSKTKAAISARAIRCVIL